MTAGVSDAAGACLGDDTITALLEGGLGEDAARAARAHISGCAACRRLVSAAIDADTNPAPPTNPFLEATPRGIAPGSLIAGKYRIEGLLGEGGMGRVYAARQTGLERPVAMKVLRPELARDAVALTRFHREARLIASLVSEHVVRVHDLGALDTGEPYLVMERLEGEDLGTVVQRGALPLDQAVALVLSACEALAEAHALGIVHRDIKPSNLFLTRQRRLKVLDFGIAKLAAPTGASLAMTGAGVVLGSPRYMAPEQITGSRDVDHRADIWSLGATLYHLATGYPPFAEPTLEAIFASILSGRSPPLLAHIPGPVAQVIHRALARDPAARFATVGELALALQASGAHAGSPPGPRAELAVAPTIEQRGAAVTAGPRRWWLAFSAVAVTVVGVAVAVVRPWADRSRPPAAAGSATTAGPAPISDEAPGPTPGPVAPSGGGALAPSGAGPLGNLDETRLQRRLEKLGWTIDQITRESFPGCDHTRLLISNGATRNADVYLFACSSPAGAASEAARMRRSFPSSWVVEDSSQVLSIMLPTESESRQLADDLVSSGGAGIEGPPLALYVPCFNAGERRVQQSWRSYLSWVDRDAGPTGREPLVSGIDEINDYDAGVCLKNLEQAVANAGAGPLADATRSYQAALTALIGVVAEAHTYYEHRDFKDDGFARGKALHRELVRAYDGWDRANLALEAVWDDQHRARRVTDLAAIEQHQGQRSERFVATAVMNAAEELIEATLGHDDPTALAAAITTYQAAFAAMKAFFGPGLTPSTDTDRYTFAQAADALLVQAKEAGRRLRAGQPLPAQGDGSKARLVQMFDALIERCDATTWDGGDAGLRRARGPG